MKVTEIVIFATYYPMIFYTHYYSNISVCIRCILMNICENVNLGVLNISEKFVGDAVNVLNVTEFVIFATYYPMNFYTQ